MIENGNVNLPRDAHWRDDFLVEVLAFPHGKNDDQVDSMTQALIWMKDDKPTGGSMSANSDAFLWFIWRYPSMSAFRVRRIPWAEEERLADMPMIKLPCE